MPPHLNQVLDDRGHQERDIEEVAVALARNVGEVVAVDSASIQLVQIRYRSAPLSPSFSLDRRVRLLVEQPEKIQRPTRGRHINKNKGSRLPRGEQTQL